MKRTNVLFITVLIAVLLFVGCAAADNVQYTIGNVQINSATGTGTADLIMSAVPSTGLSGYKLNLAIADPTVIEITDVSYPSSLKGMSDYTPTPFTSGYISWVDTNEKLQAGNTNTNLQMATITFTALKAGSTTMTVGSTMITDDSGNSLLPTTTINTPVTLNVYSTPAAAFTYSPSSPIIGDTVSFTDASTGNIVSYAWSFGDGATSADKSPTHSYTTAGTYTVTETVTNPAGTNTASQSVVVISAPVPVAAFSTSSTNGLVGTATATFTDASTNTPTAWVWEYRIADNGAWTQFSTAQSPTFTPTAAGTYDIRLTATNSGGSNTVTKTHVFSAANEHDYLTTVGSGTVSGDIYTNSVSPFTTSASQTFTLPSTAVGNVTWARLYVDTYSGSYSSQYGLTSVVTLDSTTLGTETMDVWQGFSSSTGWYAYPVNDHVMKVMSDYEATYDVTSLITTASPTVTVTSSALSGYSFDGRIKGITLVVAYNDGDSDRVQYIVNHGSDWMGPAGTASSTSFDASSFASGWTSASLKTVAHSSTDASYTLNSNTLTKSSLGTSSYWKYNQFDLTSTLNAGSANTLGYTAVGASFKSTLAVLKARYVTAPTASFTMSKGDSSTNPASAGETVTFTSTSTVPATDSGTTYAWSFGDGSTSPEQNPTHAYTTAGTYTVTLTVTNEGGSSTATKSCYVTDKPIISLTPSSMTVNPAETTTYTITMDNAPSGLSGYNLYVTLADGSVADITAVSYPSWAQLTSSPTVPADSVRIGAVDTGQKIYPGSTGPYTLATITVKGVAAGSSAITLSGLTMDDDSGNDIDVVLNTGTVIVGSYTGPTAAFTANTTSGNYPLTVAFNSSTSTGTITTYQWDFNNDGTIDSTAANPVYTYSSLGTYSVKLTVTGPGGSNTLLQNAYITVGDGVAPTVTLVADTTSGNYPLTVAFSATTTGNVASYAWDFGDGSYSTLAAPTHTYTYPGSFTATVTVTGTGGSASDSETIAATQNAPVAGIVANPTSGTGPLTVQFTDASTGSITAYNWSFGDGSYSDEQNPTHIFTSAGAYNVTHTATGPGGVSSPATTTITVTGLGVSFAANVTSGVASAGHALPVSFTPTVTGASGSTTYFWDFGDGSTSPEANPTHSYYGHLKSFTVTLTVTSGADVASVTKTGYITTTPYIEAFPKYDSTGSLTGYYGSIPTDLDGDYVYEDVNGNSRVDYDDVVAFYDALYASWFTTNTDVDNVYDYDYSGNGNLGFEDIVALHDKILYG